MASQQLDYILLFQFPVMIFSFETNKGILWPLKPRFERWASVYHLFLTFMASSEASSEDSSLLSPQHTCLKTPCCFQSGFNSTSQNFRSKRAHSTQHWKQGVSYLTSNSLLESIPIFSRSSSLFIYTISSNHRCIVWHDCARKFNLFIYNSLCNYCEWCRLACLVMFSINHT